MWSFIEAEEAGQGNTRRLHSALDYRSPANYEATIRQETAATAA